MPSGRAPFQAEHSDVVVLANKSRGTSICTSVGGVRSKERSGRRRFRDVGRRCRWQPKNLITSLSLGLLAIHVRESVPPIVSVAVSGSRIAFSQKGTQTPTVAKAFRAKIVSLAH